ncbi:MAG: hypothetical protein JKY67_18375 [Pseudomonadales bacterium]|nr:hypothetical protein [Pseudomonadales bacterium]
MPTEAPGVGHVLHYSYLWWNEQRRGCEEGRKDRPACIIINKKTRNSETLLYVLPITHTPPKEPEHGIEIPQLTKRRLGLDNERSWIIVTEFNKFTWPGYDIRKVPSSEDYSYGILPEKLIHQVINAVLENSRKQRLTPIDRDDHT